jgi:hypothetical protein
MTTTNSKCNLCGTSDIEDGFSYNIPNDRIQIICLDCYSEEVEFTTYCEACDHAMDDDNLYDVYEVPNDWNLPSSVENRMGICTDCMNDPEVTDNEFSLVVPVEDTLQSIENKLDMLSRYLGNRSNVVNDYSTWSISADELNRRLDQINTLLSN